MGFISLHFSVSLKAAAVNLKHTCTHLARNTHSSLFQVTKTKLRTKDWTAAPLFVVQSGHKRALKQGEASARRFPSTHRAQSPSEFLTR